MKAKVAADLQAVDASQPTDRPEVTVHLDPHEFIGADMAIYRGKQS